jgi:hypothetical protein
LTQYMKSYIALYIFIGHPQGPPISRKVFNVRFVDGVKCVDIRIHKLFLS